MSINREGFELVLIERFNEQNQLASTEPREYLVESGALIERVGQSLRVYIPKKAEWVAGSVPPIGTECEAKNRMNDTWRKVKIIDHQGSTQSAVCREITTDKLWWSDSFRPVKAVEEIAKETRKKEVDEMVAAMSESFGDGVYPYAEALHKAGYRKVLP